MSNKVKSALGVEVDFDQLRIKQQLSQVPSNKNVKAREQLIERRINRRNKKKEPEQLIEEQNPPVEPVFSSTDNPVEKVTKKQQIKTNKE